MKKSETEWVLGYGTLLNDYNHYVQGWKRNGIPVTVSGWRRIYNGSAYQNHLGVAANVERHPTLFFNAVMFPVAPVILREIDRRELFYKRVQVPVAYYDEPSSIESYPDQQPWLYYIDNPVHTVNTSVCLPGERDWYYAVIGAAQFGAGFLRDFFKTTFLANRKVVVPNAEKAVRFLKAYIKKAGR
jgi:hypothetical protein